MAARSKVNLLRFLLALLVFSACAGAVFGKKDGGIKDKKDSKAKEKKKKDIRDYNDADMERLFMEWEEGEDEHDPDDLLEHERPPPAVDLSQIDPNNPESALKLTKKGKTLMMFVSVSGSPTEEETETITTHWQTMLFNANYQLQRYPVSSDRVIFMLKDGSLAWDIKNFLIQEDRCLEVSIEGQVYHGKGSGKEVDGKGKTIGVDDVEKKPVKKQQAKVDKQAKTDKPKKGKSEKKPSKSDDIKKDKAKTAKPTPSKQDQKTDRKKAPKVKHEEPDPPEDTFFQPIIVDEDDDDDAVAVETRDKPRSPSERLKKSKEKYQSRESAEPFVIPSDYIEESDSPTEKKNKDEL